jgi:hypothetical protein
MPITRILHLEMLGFLFVLFAVIAYMMVAGRISLSGLLRRKDGSGQLSPAPIQLLIMTLAVCAGYLVEVVYSARGNIPDVSISSLYLLGGSSSIYLARKAWTTWTTARRN